MGGQPVRIIFSGVTGGVGRSLVPAILRDPRFELTGAVARRGVGRDVGTVLGLGEPVGVTIAATVADALAERPADVLLDFSAASAAAVNCHAAAEAGVAVIIGTTAVDAEALEEIGRIGEARRVGVFLAPNLTIAGQLMFRCADLIRPYFGDVEIIDSHPPTKLDAPSGTARETAHRLGVTPAPEPTADHTERGLPAARGAVSGTVRLHSVRLPSFFSRHEVLFSRPGEMLTITCDMTSNDALIGPTLKAARLILQERGVVRDLPGLFDPD
jgi:4-hydroxy-tetrahydrodipicolinate reductase